MPDKELLLSWSRSEILESAVKCRFENIFEFGYKIDGDKDFAKCLQAADGDTTLCSDIIDSYGLRDKLEEYWYSYLSEDYLYWELEWEHTVDYLTELINERSPTGYWRVDMTNFGWREQDGWKELYADTGAEFLRQVLPKTDCTFYVYSAGEGGLAINNFHHDSIWGKEWYYATPYDPYEDEEDNDEYSQDYLAA